MFLLDALDVLLTVLGWNLGQTTRQVTSHYAVRYIIILWDFKYNFCLEFMHLSVATRP